MLELAADELAELAVIYDECVAPEAGLADRAAAVFARRGSSDARRTGGDYFRNRVVIGEAQETPQPPAPSPQ
jgi:hypothetical protein